MSSEDMGCASDVQAQVRYSVDIEMLSDRNNRNGTIDYVAVVRQ